MPEEVQIKVPQMVLTQEKGIKKLVIGRLILSAVSMIKAPVFMELQGTHVDISTLSSAENSPVMEPDNHVDAN